LAAGFWVVAFALLCVTSLATVPSPLYGLYQHRDALSLFAITVVYAGYAIGIVVSLFLAGHVSDWYGRKVILLPALALAAFSAVIFILWPSFSGILVARIVNGVSLGAALATATAYILELDAALHPGTRSGRGLAVSTVVNIGGLGFGALISGLFAQYVAHPLVVPYEVFLVALVLAIGGVTFSPETRVRTEPLPRYHPQRIEVPAESRAPYLASLLGIGVDFAAFGLFAGLAGTILVASLHRQSLALAGVAVFVTFTASVGAQLTLGSWPTRRLAVCGVAGILVGLAVIVMAVWLPTPNLVLFLVGDAITGAGGGAVFRCTLGVVTAVAPPAARAEVLAGFFLAGYVGLSVPVVGVGIALQYVSVNVTLLVFAIAVGIGALVVLPILMRPSNQQPGKRSPMSNSHVP
jgi:MFS family permease